MKKPINEIERLKLIAGLINEVEYNDSVYGVKRTTLTEGKKKHNSKPDYLDLDKDGNKKESMKKAAKDKGHGKKGKKGMTK